MKKTLAKIVKQQKPDSQSARDEQIKAITVFVKEKYLNMKSIHLGEIQSVIAELSVSFSCTAFNWICKLLSAFSSYFFCFLASNC